ncbi:MAG: hypothetical protein ACFFDN_38765 [Candidatus Hodarchaeota archaeon]
MFFNTIREILIRLDFLIVLLTIELSLIFIRQWYVEKKERSENLVSLSYGIYYNLIGIGFALYSLRRYYLNDNPLWRFFEIQSDYSYFLLILTILIMSCGSLLFSVTLEFKYRKFLKTKFIFSLFLAFLLCIILFLQNTPYFFPSLNSFAFFSALFPYLFIYYLIINSLGKIRRKLILGAISLIIAIIGLAGISDQGIKVLKNISPYFEPYLIIFQLLTVFGLILLIYSFLGFNLLLEAQWKGNIISLFIIDKERGNPLYTKKFLLDDQVSKDTSQFLALGLKGIIGQINELSETKKDLHIIDKENVKIILHYGEKIISAFLIKKALMNIHYFLSQVTLKFEENFLPVYDLWLKEVNIFKPMDKIIEELIPSI